MQELALGGRIRSLRQARRLTLRELAARAGVTESFLSQVEREVASPSIATVQRIARSLDLSIAQLFAEEPTTGRVVRREAPPRGVPGIHAVDEFLTSNPAGRLQVIRSEIEPAVAPVRSRTPTTRRGVPDGARRHPRPMGGR